MSTSTQNALVVQARGKASVVPDHPIPTLRPDTVLIRPVAVALNPHDWKAIDYLYVEGCVVGCDFSGVVEAISDDPVARSFNIGDRVIATAHGSKLELRMTDRKTPTYTTKPTRSVLRREPFKNM